MKTPIYHNPENVRAELVDPENEGWRLMLVEEIKSDGREATPEIELWKDGKWNDTWWCGTSQSSTYRTKWPLPAEYLVNENQWIAFCDRKPTKEDFPVIAVRVGYHDERPNVYLGLGEYHLLTHWIKADIPPIPEKVKTQQDLDEEFIKKEMEGSWDNCSREVVRRMMRATLKYARGEK